jgi:tRNA threonylcarbamoyladenosine biosynthesis protein TsaB
VAVVGFDTATDDTAVGVVRGGEVLYESLLGPAEKGGPLHTTSLLGEVERAVAAAGGWEAVERIAVGLGPGTFTGLRVGIATAKGLGLSRALPVAGVCTLDALAAGLAEAAGEDDRLVVTDARRGEAFAALYAPGGERRWGPLVAGPDEIAERIAGLARPALCAGSGAVRFRQQLASRGVEIPDDADPVHRIAARHICALARTGSGEDGSGSVAPIYLRAPDAERWRERGERWRERGTVKKAE